MAFRSSLGWITKRSRAAAWVSVPLFIPCMVIDGVRIIGIALKGLLVRRWAMEIMDRVASENKASGQGYHANGCNNLAGLGGQDLIVRRITWDELFADTKSAELRRWGHRPNVVREYFFFAYFGPLEAWCDRNLHSGYYLWSDETRINLVLTDPMDEVLWKMSWGKGMPRLEDFGSDSDEVSLP